MGYRSARRGTIVTTNGTGYSWRCLIGKTLAHYEIAAWLGEGGMGQVYRARDTKLKRDIALKVLPEKMSTDTER